MNIRLKTKVDVNYKDIIRQFDRNLFEALKPKYGKMEIVEFTGSKKDDIVHLKFLSPIKTEWVSKIIDDGENQKEAFFIDEGTTLPFPLGPTSKPVRSSPARPISKPYIKNAAASAIALQWC